MLEGPPITNTDSSKAPLLATLRQQMSAQFPVAHENGTSSPSYSLSANLPDFPSGALSEVSPAHPASGLSLILAEILSTDLDPSHGEDRSCITSSLSDNPVVLIDGRDSFDPSSYGGDSCSRLLWIRCHNSRESLQCCDLLLHDGTLPLLVLDFLLTPLRELHLIPSSSWYRLRKLAKRSDTSVLLFTPQHLIPCAALQISLDSTFTLSDLERDRNDLRPTYSHRKMAVHHS